MSGTNINLYVTNSLVMFYDSMNLFCDIQIYIHILLVLSADFFVNDKVNTVESLSTGQAKHHTTSKNLLIYCDSAKKLFYLSKDPSFPMTFL